MIAKLFLPGFLSLIASLKATGVVLSLFQYSQLVLLLHFHDRHASYSCLVAVPTSLAERYSPGYFLLYSKFKTISLTVRPTSSCFQLISVPGRSLRAILSGQVRCKTNNNILLFYPLVQDANDSFVPCFAFVLCIMTSAVPFYMDLKPFSHCTVIQN